MYCKISHFEICRFVILNYENPWEFTMSYAISSLNLATGNCNCVLSCSMRSLDFSPNFKLEFDCHNRKNIAESKPQYNIGFYPQKKNG